MISVLFSLLVSATPFEQIESQFDVQDFTKKVLASEYYSLSSQMKKKFGDAFLKTLKTKFLNSEWKQIGQWKTQGHSRRSIFFHPKHQEVEVVLLQNPKTKKYYDLKFDGVSALVTVAGRIQKKLLTQTPQQVLMAMNKAQ